MEELKVDILTLKKAALILRAINHKLRIQILKLINTHGKLTVTEIYVKLRLEQSVASQHLAILRKAGYVNTERDGKFIYYSVNHQRLVEIAFGKRRRVHATASSPAKTSSRSSINFAGQRRRHTPAPGARPTPRRNRYTLSPRCRSGE